MTKQKPEPGTDPLKLTVELTEDQCLVVQDALDLYSRIHLGQFQDIEWRLRVDRGFKDEYDTRLAENALFVARGIIFPELGSDRSVSYGIYQEKVPDRARIAWDIQQVIRYTHSWHRNPNGGMTGNYDKPMQSPGTEALPVASIRGKTKYPIKEND